MKELILVVGPGQPDLTSCQITAGEKNWQTVVHWEGWEAPKGHVSLLARLRAELEIIRAEHAAWAYDLGRLTAEDGKEVQDGLRAGHPLSMWWCSLLYERHPKMTPGLYAVYKLRALERYMDEEDFSALRLFGGDEMLRDVLAGMCASSGRDFSEEHGVPAPLEPPVSFLRRLYNAAPAPLRALARYGHWWWTVRRKLPATPEAGKTFAPVLAQGQKPEQGAVQGQGEPIQTATIATYFPNVDMKAAGQGRFRSRYWESLHDVLHAAAQKDGAPWVRWLFIRFPAPQLSLAQCVALRDRFRQEAKDGASFHYLEEFLRHRDLWAALWRYLRLCLGSRNLESTVQPAFQFAGSHLNFWPYLESYWVESFRGWRGLERCLQQQAFDVYAGAAGPQRWTLFPLENCPWERMLTVSMREAGAAATPCADPVAGPVIGAQHSTVRPSDFRYFDDPRTFEAPCDAFQPDVVRGNGQSACEQWLQAGMPPQRLGEVEALRYLYLAENAGAVPQSTASVTPEGPAVPGEDPAAPAVPGRGEAASAQPKRLLAVTSFFRDETEAHLVLLARALHAGLLDGWQIVVKPHPYLPVEERLRALLGRRASEVRVALGAIGEELVPGVVVWSSNSTTVALEAALKGLAVMSMLPVDDFDLCPLQDVPHLPRTGSVEDVAQALAAAAPLQLPANYLDLDPALPRWK
ncbi:MAG: hypothetical protein PHI96_06180 [Desulfovibrio sp.]|nr:hypothetical protein [Desulfovibrio sp.]